MTKYKELRGWLNLRFNTKIYDGDIEDIMRMVDEEHLRGVTKEYPSFVNMIREEVIGYIANSMGWEETGDLYREHYGLPIKYPKK
jgi:hypothetical protein